MVILLGLLHGLLDEETGLLSSSRSGNGKIKNKVHFLLAFLQGLRALNVALRRRALRGARGVDGAWYLRRLGLGMVSLVDFFSFSDFVLEQDLEVLLLFRQSADRLVLQSLLLDDLLLKLLLEVLLHHRLSNKRT